LIKGFHKLPPATTLVLEPDGGTRTTRYWQPDYRRNGSSLTEREWEDRVENILRTSVKRRLTADVPVGVLLSGGLDSSLIVGLLAENGASDLSTFSIGFEDHGSERGNEFEYSDVIAERFRTDHHKISIDSSTLVDHLPECIDAMAEPMVSHDAIGFYLLSKRVAEHMKVVQSGQGADEIFGGYDWYPPMLASEHAVSDYARVFFDRTWAEYQNTVEHDYIDRDHSLQFVTDHFNQPGADRAIDKAMRLDTTVMLVEDPVKRVDNMTMAWGVEARVPFLDHEVVEVAAQCPPELKIKNHGKFVLKNIARRMLPQKVVDRPKGYFPVPALKYANGTTLDFMRDVLHNRAARERGVFRPEYVSQLLAEPTRHITPLKGSKLWQIALLETWLQAQRV
jgi:asparagine synthase (glutamine-hydrolysing)